MRCNKPVSDSQSIRGLQSCSPSPHGGATSHNKQLQVAAVDLACSCGSVEQMLMLPAQVPGHPGEP